MNCIKCGKGLKNIFASEDNDELNQPLDATEFIGGGAYGSAVTDLADRRFIVYVCDPCVLAALESGACKDVSVELL